MPIRSGSPDFDRTVLVNASGVVQERYLFDPYGTFSVYDANYVVRSSSSFGWVYLHQGGRYDTTSLLVHFRNREYHGFLGRWMQRDPLGYVDGMSLYARHGGLDPFGLKNCPDANDQDPPGGQPQPPSQPEIVLEPGAQSDRMKKLFELVMATTIAARIEAVIKARNAATGAPDAMKDRLKVDKGRPGDLDPSREWGAFRSTGRILIEPDHFANGVLRELANTLYHEFVHAFHFYVETAKFGAEPYGPQEDSSVEAHNNREFRGMMEEFMREWDLIQSDFAAYRTERKVGKPVHVEELVRVEEDPKTKKKMKVLKVTRTWKVEYQYKDGGRPLDPSSKLRTFDRDRFNKIYKLPAGGTAVEETYERVPLSSKRGGPVPKDK